MGAIWERISSIYKYPAEGSGYSMGVLYNTEHRMMDGVNDMAVCLMWESVVNCPVTFRTAVGGDSSGLKGQTIRRFGFIASIFPKS